VLQEKARRFFLLRISCQKMMIKFLMILPENAETTKLSDVSWCRTRNSSVGGGIRQNARVLRKEKGLHQISGTFCGLARPLKMNSNSQFLTSTWDNSYPHPIEIPAT